MTTNGPSETGLTRWHVLVAHQEGTRPALRQAQEVRQQGTSSSIVFEMLALRANISNKKKEKYHTAVGHSTGAEKDVRFGIIRSLITYILHPSLTSSTLDSNISQPGNIKHQFLI